MTKKTCNVLFRIGLLFLLIAIVIMTGMVDFLFPKAVNLCRYALLFASIGIFFVVPKFHNFTVEAEEQYRPMTPYERWRYVYSLVVGTLGLFVFFLDRD